MLTETPTSAAKAGMLMVVTAIAAAIKYRFMLNLLLLTVLDKYLIDELSRLIFAYSRVPSHRTGEAVVQVTAMLFDFVADHAADRAAASED
jgi:hypothetical protein